MTLREWILRERERRGLLIRDVAAALDTTESTLFRHMSGARFPRKGMILRVWSLTGGEVTANDWYADHLSDASSVAPVGSAA